MIRALQLVTQLEPAGAQAIAAWIQTHVVGAEDSVDADIQWKTIFFYLKAPSDLFPNPVGLASTRPAGVRAGFRFVVKVLGLRRTRPAIVVAHTHFAISVAALLWVFDKRVPVIAVHHWPEARYPRSVRLVLRVARKMNAFAEEVYVSSATRSSPKSGIVIANAVPGRRITDFGVDEDEDEDETGSTSVGHDLVVVARHAPEKSLVTAIESLTHLPGRSLTLVGGGELTEDLHKAADRAAVADRVDFVGRLSNSDVRRVMQSASALVQSSLWEAMPVAMLEAISADLDIVATRIDGHEWAIALGAAVPFETEDALGLAEAVRSLRNQDVRAQLAAGRQRVKEIQSEKRIAAEWRVVIARVQGRSSSGVPGEFDRTLMEWAVLRQPPGCSQP